MQLRHHVKLHIISSNKILFFYSVKISHYSLIDYFTFKQKLKRVASGQNKEFYIKLTKSTNNYKPHQDSSTFGKTCVNKESGSQMYRYLFNA